MILARATSPRVERTGVAAGMSGSPVYVDGKLIGALSSGWSFSREPVFGITPIGEMLQVLDQPRPSDGGGTTGPTGLEPPASSATSYRGLAWSDPPARPLVVAPRSSPEPDAAPTALPIPVSCVGFDPAVLPFARQMLEPLGLAAVPGGKTGAAAPTNTNLEPGSAVAIDLLRGDLQMAAIRTVTWRDGDRVLIFGHPLFQSGAVKLPLASAEITTVVASNLISFKLGSSVQPVGVATQDRRAAVAGQMGPVPRLMPLSVHLRNQGDP